MQGLDLFVQRGQLPGEFVALLSQGFVVRLQLTPVAPLVPDGVHPGRPSVWVFVSRTLGIDRGVGVGVGGAGVRRLPGGSTFSTLGVAFLFGRFRFLVWVGTVAEAGEQVSGGSIPSGAQVFEHSQLVSWDRCICHQDSS